MRGVSFSLAVDAIDIVTGVQISLELTEGYTETAKSPSSKEPKVTVRHF